MVDIPPDTAITLVAQFPNGVMDWPAPPAWTTSAPDTSVLAIVDNTDQKQCTATASANLTVTLDSGALHGSLDLAIVPEAAAPTEALALIIS